MDRIAKKLLLATFILCIILQISDGFKLDYKSYLKYGNRNLERFRRHTVGQACKGDTDQFQCASTADCIHSYLECDGKEDCPDGSDEKESLCKNIKCPEYLFRCDYGACISLDQKCDGQKDCNDNSDEANCSITNRTMTHCRSDQFECFDGQCIGINDTCNGVAECYDKSDETEQLCCNIFCPGYTYKCKYGACVDGDAECNGRQDCLDNSDEDEKICNATTPRVPKNGKKCTTPQQPKQGQWVYPNGTGGPDPNVQVDPSTVIIFSCDTGYKLSVTSGDRLPVVCMETGEWTTTVEITCQKLCPSQYSIPPITLICINDGSVVSCDKATDGTILTYKCAPYYEIPYGKPNISSCFDGSWSHTPECIPACGQKKVSSTSLIVGVGGVDAERGNYPWVVALYSNKNTDPFFTNICGGSLLTTNVVLTAAHCVTKKETGKIYPAKYYRVAAGKYYNEYMDPKDEDTAQYAVVDEIEVHRDYRGEIQNYRGDIALLKLKTKLALSEVVQPVCYHNLPPLTPNTDGLVLGWGYTTQRGQPAEKLNELKLPYNDDSQCFNEFDSDFAARYFISDKLCAGFTNKNISVCKGDSGGGLVFRNPSYKQRFFIHGIVSLGPSYTENQQIVCDVQRSALFTKVETYLSWIQMTIHRWNSNKPELR